MKMFSTVKIRVVQILEHDWCSKGNSSKGRDWEQKLSLMLVSIP